MNELGPHARALLDIARASSAPTAAQADRLWGRVSGALAAPQPGAANKASISPGAGPVAAIAAAAAATLAVAALFIARPHGVPATAPPIAPAPPTIASSLATSSAEAPAPAADAIGADRALALPAAATPSSAISAPPVPRSAPARGSASSTDDAHGDVALVRSAYAALQMGDAARSLALLDEHARRFPASALGEERDATRVLALCALGRRVDARSALERFRRAYPSAMQLQRIPAACAEEVPR